MSEPFGRMSAEGVGIEVPFGWSCKVPPLWIRANESKLEQKHTRLVSNPQMGVSSRLRDADASVAKWKDGRHTGGGTVSNATEDAVLHTVGCMRRSILGRYVEMKRIARSKTPTELQSVGSIQRTSPNRSVYPICACCHLLDEM